MMGVRQLAPATAELYGPGRMVIIYTVGRRRRLRAQLVRGVYMPGLPFLQGGR